MSPWIQAWDSLVCFEGKQTGPIVFSVSRYKLMYHLYSSCPILAKEATWRPGNSAPSKEAFPNSAGTPTASQRKESVRSLAQGLARNVH